MPIGKKFADYEGKRSNHLKLMEIKIISFTTKLIVEKNSKRLTVEDYDRISLEAFRNKSVTNRLRIFRMVTSTPIKEKINQNLLDYYNAKNINLNVKIEDLMGKAEELVKNTTDCINLAKFYKDIADEGKDVVKANNLTQINNNFHTYRNEEKEITEPEKEITEEELTQTEPTEE